MRFQIAVGCVSFFLGAIVGFGCFRALNQQRSEKPTMAADLSDKSEYGLPCVATLMARDRSMESVQYFLTKDIALEMIGRFGVFEAMITGPSNKAPTLSFWTSGTELTYRGIPYFPVRLGTDLCPSSLAMYPLGHNDVMVVRYLARMCGSADGDFFLEKQTLLGYAIMDVETAKQIAVAGPPPKADNPNVSEDRPDQDPRLKGLQFKNSRQGPLPKNLGRSDASE